jgi:alpha/beta superfamily hydrolase
MRVTIPNADLSLEGDLTLPPGATRAAVICHPHPQYGGDMHNPVVRTVEAALQQSHFATLRFNFRGVGRSAGSYGGGIGEQDDARAAVAFLQEQSGGASITLSGYSFGAMVALQAGATLAAVDRLIAVAPPVVFFDLAFLATCTKPKLFIAGDHDQYCGVSDLTRQLAGVPEPKTHHILPGADHFLYGHDSAVATAVSAFVAC